MKKKNTDIKSLPIYILVLSYVIVFKSSRQLCVYLNLASKIGGLRLKYTSNSSNSNSNSSSNRKR